MGMPFPRRVNSDGTIDSICDRCFVTVGTSSQETELHHLDAAHTCEPARVAYYHRTHLTAKRPAAAQQGDPEDDKLLRRNG